MKIDLDKKYDKHIDKEICNYKKYEDGRRILKEYIKIERNANVIKDAKRMFLKKNGRLFCEICGFDFQEVYFLCF